MPAYDHETGWKAEAQRADFIQKNRLRSLRIYQQRAAQAIQAAVANGKTGFLFEMATGTEKTLTSAAVINFFLRTGNARTVFAYFAGYKLGQTATPKDYLKKFDAAKPTTTDARQQERRLLLAASGHQHPASASCRPSVSHTHLHRDHHSHQHPEINTALSQPERSGS